MRKVNIHSNHEKKFSDKEFEEIIMKAVLSILNENKIKEKDKISFQDIFSEVVEELIKNFVR